MSSEALRAGLYALGSMLVFVGGLDDALVLAGIPALGLISAGIAKILLAAGTLAVGWAKTNRFLGDFKLADVSDALRDTVSPPKPADTTSPGIGGPKV